MNQLKPHISMLIPKYNRSITTLAGMQFAALKNSLCMPHNPYSPLTIFVMQRINETGKRDLNTILAEWSALSEKHKEILSKKSERVSFEYYQCLSVCVNDRQRLAKEIVMLHSDPNFIRLSLEQQAFLDSLPVYKSNSNPSEYFENVSRYINGMNIKEIEHTDSKK